MTDLKRTGTDTDRLIFLPIYYSIKVNPNKGDMMNPPEVKGIIVDEKLHMRVMKHCLELSTPERKMTARRFTEQALENELKRTGEKLG